MNSPNHVSGNTNLRDELRMSPEVAPSIVLELREKLRDPDYREQFFWAETSARIARDLIKLRKRRGHNQKQLADLLHTKQPAISRIEQADYENWNLSTLRAIAKVEDARIRVIIEPAEDVLSEYETSAEDETETAPIGKIVERAASTHQPDPREQWLETLSWRKRNSAKAASTSQGGRRPDEGEQGNYWLFLFNRGQPAGGAQEQQLPQVGI